MISYGAELFDALFPGFLDAQWIRNLPKEEVYEEMIMELSAFSEDNVHIDCPEGITFGMYSGELSTVHAAVREVDEDWVQYFDDKGRIYCAFDGGRIVSFCLLDAFGIWQGKQIGGPGCVGTIPAYRRQGIGLKMVQNATALLKAEGYDISYIHYTGVGSWYAHLGYETAVRWGACGIL